MGLGSECGLLISSARREVSDLSIIPSDKFWIIMKTEFHGFWYKSPARRQNILGPGPARCKVNFSGPDPARFQLWLKLRKNTNFLIFIDIKEKTQVVKSLFFINVEKIERAFYVTKQLLISMLIMYEKMKHGIDCITE